VTIEPISKIDSQLVELAMATNTDLADLTKKAIDHVIAEWGHEPNYVEADHARAHVNYESEDSGSVELYVELDNEYQVEDRHGDSEYFNDLFDAGSRLDDFINGAEAESEEEEEEEEETDKPQLTPPSEAEVATNLAVHSLPHPGLALLTGVVVYVGRALSLPEPYAVRDYDTRATVTYTPPGKRSPWVNVHIYPDGTVQANNQSGDDTRLLARIEGIRQVLEWAKAELS